MKMNILFVCTGNLCRSVLAEGILKKTLKAQAHDSVFVSSAGTMALVGSPAAELAIEVAAERGIDLSKHVARQLTPELLEQADLVAFMEMNHVVEANCLSSDREGKYCLLSDFGPAGLRGKDIEDPYGSPVERFHVAYEEIATCVAGLSRHLEKELRRRK